MDEDERHELRRFFAALADENRLAVAGVLAMREASVQDIAAQLRMKDSDVARHVSLLHESGIVSRTREGSLQIWQLDVEALRERRRRLLTRERAPSPADEEGTPAWERLVLRNFFDGERLKEIPANLKKRMVVLGWLADRFEWDRQYPEREVNEIIKRYHPDASALRRELIDHRFMQRENGAYWRLDRAG
jgi:DNA-binding transcriptional ArsR family regulator